MASDAIKAQMDACPNKKNHTKGQPDGYIDWHNWAEKKINTHKQIRCDGCGLFVIWVKR